MSTTNPKNMPDLAKITTYQAGAVQAAVHRLLQKHSDEILRPYGISKMQWMIIGTILDSGDTGARITALAKALDTTLPYLTNSLNTLEAQGIIIRISDAADSRAKKVTITPEFKPECSKIEATMREKLRETIYARVSAEDFRVYMKVMYQLLDIS